MQTGFTENMKLKNNFFDLKTTPSLEGFFRDPIKTINPRTMATNEPIRIPIK